MTEPNVSQGAPTAETGDVASWRAQKTRRAMQLKEDRGRPSMGLAKAGFEAAESRLDDFRFSPDSRWANGWPEMGGGPGEALGQGGHGKIRRQHRRGARWSSAEGQRVQRVRVLILRGLVLAAAWGT